MTLTEMITMLQGISNNETNYDAAYLSEAIKFAVLYVNTRISTAFVVDSTAVTITPEPNDAQSMLIVYKTMADITRNDFKNNANNGVKVKNDIDEIDTRGKNSGIITIMNSAEETYKTAEWAYLSANHVGELTIE